MNPRRVAAIGVFSALAYVGSFVMMAIPNATLSILLVFFAGFYLDMVSGLIVGVVSSMLISLFNPYGMVMLPLLGAQVLGYALIGGAGGLFAHRFFSIRHQQHLFMLITLGIVTALAYQVPVSIVDAYLYGPFWERLAMSAAFAAITLVTNTLFFVILFPFLAKLKKVAIFRLG